MLVASQNGACRLARNKGETRGSDDENKKAAAFAVVSL